jgi:hypothetical protein
VDVFYGEPLRWMWRVEEWGDEVFKTERAFEARRTKHVHCMQLAQAQSGHPFFVKVVASGSGWPTTRSEKGHTISRDIFIVK